MSNSTTTKPRPQASAADVGGHLFDEVVARVGALLEKLDELGLRCPEWDLAPDGAWYYALVRREWVASELGAAKGAVEAVRAAAKASGPDPMHKVLVVLRLLSQQLDDERIRLSTRDELRRWWQSPASEETPDPPPSIANEARIAEAPSTPSSTALMKRALLGPIPNTELAEAVGVDADYLSQELRKALEKARGAKSAKLKKHKAGEKGVCWSRADLDRAVPDLRKGKIKKVLGESGFRNPTQT